MSLKKSQLYMQKKEEPDSLSVEQVRRTIEKEWFCHLYQSCLSETGWLAAHTWTEEGKESDSFCFAPAQETRVWGNRK